jgi:hypothetical protein
MACLKTTYRGVIEILEISEALPTELGMKQKLPHYNTLAKFCDVAPSCKYSAPFCTGSGKPRFGKRINRWPSAPRGWKPARPAPTLSAAANETARNG